MTASERTARVTITGRVQGVGFRAFVEYEAARRGLRGWVRNRRDGSVEAVFAGSSDVVDDMLAACRRGPRSARVDHVNVEPETAALLQNARAGDAFEVLPTA
jgi:acylphosphatase